MTWHRHPSSSAPQKADWRIESANELTRFIMAVAVGPSTEYIGNQNRPTRILLKRNRPLVSDREECSGLAGARLPILKDVQEPAAKELNAVKLGW